MVTPYGRMDCVPNVHPLYSGGLGRAWSPEAMEVVHQADTLLAVGSRLSHFTTFYDDRYVRKDIGIIQIEIDQTKLGKNHPVAVGILGDAKAVTGALVRLLGKVEHPPEREARFNLAHQLRIKRQRRLESEPPVARTPLKPQQVYH